MMLKTFYYNGIVISDYDDNRGTSNEATLDQIVFEVLLAVFKVFLMRQ
jgi:hypothetical protein